MAWEQGLFDDTRTLSRTAAGIASHTHTDLAKRGPVASTKRPCKVRKIILGGSLTKS